MTRLFWSGKAFTPSAALDEPLTKPSRVKEIEKDAPTKDASQEKMEQTDTGEDKRGDLLICGFWARGTDCMSWMHASLMLTPNPAANGILPKC